MIELDGVQAPMTSATNAIPIHRHPLVDCICRGSPQREDQATDENPDDGLALNVVDAHADPRAVEIPGTADTHEQLVAVPLVENDIVTGALLVARIGEHDRAFTAAEFDLIQVFASLASIALQNAARYFKVRSYADLDTLTGLRNRGAFQRDLAALVASSSSVAAYGWPMSAEGEIREFLTSRRAKVSPEQAGLPVFGRNRRVAGLRREEVDRSYGSAHR